MRVSGVKYLLGKGVENVWKNRMMAFASFCVLLVSLLLVGTSILAYVNLSTMISGIEDKNEVIIYFEENTTEQEMADFHAQLEQIGNISDVSFYSKEQALEDLKKDMPDYEMLFDSLDEDNPLLDAFRVRIDDISTISSTIAQIQKLDHIFSIRAPMEFVRVLTEVRRIVSILFGVILLALIIISVVIISNAIKASVFARREEIMIMRYVGASNSFIKIPFFIEGMITGLCAGVVALVITWISYDALVNLLTENVDVLRVFGGNILHFQDVFWRVAGSYLIVGMLFGAFGSTLSLRRHLDV